MEIKKVEKQIKVEYPKINEISSTRVKKAIPDKWLKLGVTSFLFNILIKSDIWAFADGEISGAAPVYETETYYFIKNGCNIITVISALAFIISSIMIIIKKSKGKKQGENIKVSKKIKIICITSIILLILSIIGYYIAEYFKYYY